MFTITAVQSKTFNKIPNNKCNNYITSCKLFSYFAFCIYYNLTLRIYCKKKRKNNNVGMSFSFSYLLKGNENMQTHSYDI